MKRIVVGIDGSEQGWSALAKAGDLARATGAGLQIAHVSPPVPWLFAAEYRFGAAGWIEAQEKFGKGCFARRSRGSRTPELRWTQ